MIDPVSAEDAHARVMDERKAAVANGQLLLTDLERSEDRLGLGYKEGCRDAVVALSGEAPVGRDPYAPIA